MNQLKGLDVPASVREAIGDITKHYDRYIDVLDTDQAAKLHIDAALKHFSGNQEFGSKEEEAKEELDVVNTT